MHCSGGLLIYYGSYTFRLMNVIIRESSLMRLPDDDVYTSKNVGAVGY
jgi:hypothetical protein